MYRFSRSLYRELANDVVSTRGEDVAIARQWFLKRCEYSMERLALDRHYFAPEAGETLFRDIRHFFPMTEQLRVYRACERLMTQATGTWTATCAPGSRSTAARSAVTPARVGVPRASACRCRDPLLPVAQAPRRRVRRRRGGVDREAVASTPRSLARWREHLHRCRVAHGRAARDRQGATTPADQSDSVLDAVEQALYGRRAEPRVEGALRARHDGGHDALLEGRVARTALLATEGFTDLEELGPGAPRAVPALRRPSAPDRARGAAAGGSRAQRARRRAAPLDEQALAASLGSLAKVEAVAVCLLWGFRHPGHEQRWPSSWRERGRAARVQPRETAGVFREYERCATAIVDACCAATSSGWRSAPPSPASEPEVMLSSGGTANAATAGPATAPGRCSPGRPGARWARRAWRARTPSASTWAAPPATCRWCSAAQRRSATDARAVGGRALARTDGRRPHRWGRRRLDRLARRGGALRVGPRSAGADPGPACYGRGGEEPTVTDANLLLSTSIQLALAGGVRLDRQGAEHAVARLLGELGLDIEEAAAGIARVASSEMAGAVRVMTVERGIDPRELALIAFGGAEPLHAAGIAEELGMRRVIVPLAAGVLSALGLVVSERRRDVLRSVLLTGKELTREAVGAAVRELGEQGRGDLGAPDAELRGDLRPALRGSGLRAAGGRGARPDPADLRARFDRAHEDRYGYADSGAGLELVTIRVAAALPVRRRPSPSHSSRPSRGRAGRCSAETGSRRRCWAAGRRAWRGPRSWICAARRWSCRRDGERARTPTAW